MNLSRRQALSFVMVAALVLLAGVAAAQDIPLKNWPVTGAPSGSRTALADLGGPIPFVPMAPCRQYDSRSFTPLADNTPRTVSLIGAPCGILTGTDAVSVNITVFSITGAGSNGVFKVDTVSPPVTAWINYPPTETQRGNAGVVSLTAGGAIIVQVNQGAGSVNFTVDVNGYYIGGPSTLNSGERFHVEGSYSGGGMIKGTNNFNGAASDGGFFETYATTSGAVGAYGDAWGATGAVFGVLGETHSTTDGTAGVKGLASGATATGQTIGVLGTTASTAGQSYGVVGIAGNVTWIPVNLYQAGGRFAAAGVSGYGGEGEGQTGGFIGYRVDGTGAWQTYGIVGYSGTDGLYTPQHLTAVGGKSFAEPLPGDPSRVIKYVCPEGPESGTYFRGRGRFEGHMAVIEVPEHFRTVTAEDGLTVQVTPIGQAAAVGVIQIGLDRILVESTQDVEFSYLVQGVRKAYKDWQPVQSATPSENPYFIPQSADQRLEKFWPEEIRQRLISNGTYNADGTVNMQTAERMGWAQKWRDEEKARAEAAARVRSGPAPGTAVDGARR